MQSSFLDKLERVRPTYFRQESQGKGDVGLVEWGQVLRHSNPSLGDGGINIALTVICGPCKCRQSTGMPVSVVIMGIVMFPRTSSHWCHPEVSKLGPGVREALGKMPFPNQVNDGSWSGQGLLLRSVLVCPLLLALSVTSQTHSPGERNLPWPYFGWILSRDAAQEAGLADSDALCTQVKREMECLGFDKVRGPKDWR